MKTTVGVFFGGRSTEHEISVISALQAINAFNKEKYEIIPIYITKQGRWFSGDALLEVKNYRDMAALQKHVRRGLHDSRIRRLQPLPQEKSPFRE